jgi:hypothetical protein
MARCPFAVWHPISGSCGPHVGGPFKIVHHTTEGSSAQGAFAAFAAARSDPHFTVDAQRIYQHIDTAEGARALRNDPGGVQTNRDGAVQIELVGFAHLPKDRAALTQLARLCRWIESTHGVPRVWPAGEPKQARNGRDPGGHRRDAAAWELQGGHYGHCHVPENSHWDPGYSADEVAFLMNASFDAEGRLTSPALPPIAAAPKAARAPAARRAAEPRSTMPDHHQVPLGFAAYIRDLRLDGLPAGPAVRAVRKARSAAAPARRGRAAAAGAAAQARVNVGSLLSFVAGVSEQERNDVLYSVQLAQRGASGAFDRFTQTQSWYQRYVEILENLGWASEQMAFTRFEQSEGEFRMDQAALAVVTAIATQNQLAALQQSVQALASRAEDDGTISLFDLHASMQESGNFQLGAVQRLPNGALSMALGAFYFRSDDQRRRFLFFKWGAQQVHFWTAAQRMTLNTAFYARRRADVAARLDADASRFIAELRLG